MQSADAMTTSAPSWCASVITLFVFPLVSALVWRVLRTCGSVRDPFRITRYTYIGLAVVLAIFTVVGCVFRWHEEEGMMDPTNVSVGREGSICEMPVHAYSLPFYGWFVDWVPYTLLGVALTQIKTQDVWWTLASIPCGAGVFALPFAPGNDKRNPAVKDRRLIALAVVAVLVETPLWLPGAVRWMQGHCFLDGYMDYSSWAGVFVTGSIIVGAACGIGMAWEYLELHLVLKIALSVLFFLNNTIAFAVLVILSEFARNNRVTTKTT
jgi:hypothetical protein